MYSLDEMPTIQDQREDDLGAQTDEFIDLENASVISTTLPVNAQSGYEVFADVERIPEWVPIVSSAQILSADSDGRATRVAFVASMGRASIGYTLVYNYDDHRRIVNWRTPKEANTQVVGRAMFVSLSQRSAMMHYQLHIDMPPGAIAAWHIPEYEGHAASAALADFRDYLSRAFLI